MTEMLLAVLLTLLIGPFVVATLWVYHHLRLPAHPHYTRLDWDDPLIPVDFVHLVETTERQLYPTGFNLVSAAYTPTVNGACTYVAVYENPLGRDSAILTVRYRVTRSGSHAVARHVAFYSEYADGTLLCTDNAPTVYGASDPEHLRRQTLSGVANPVALYRLHRQFVFRLRGSTPCCLPVNLDVQYLVDIGTRRAYDHLSRGGWVHDEETDTITPGLKASAAVALREVYPGPLVRKVRQRRAVREAMDATAGLPNAPWPRTA